jgi:hypothetical protein
VNRLKKTSIAISAVSLAVSIFMWAQLSGIEYGFFYGVFREPPSRGISFSGGGWNHFQSLNVWYFWIALVLCGNLVMKLFRQSAVGNGICIVLLTFLIIWLWDMNTYKSHLAAFPVGFYSTPYPWLKASIYSDWFCLFAIVTLLIIEVSMMRMGRSSSDGFGSIR